MSLKVGDYVRLVPIQGRIGRINKIIPVEHPQMHRVYHYKVAWLDRGNDLMAGLYDPQELVKLTPEAVVKHTLAS